MIVSLIPLAAFPAFAEDEPDTLTLRDIIGKVSGTYSCEYPDPEAYITATIDSHKFCFEIIAPDNAAIRVVFDAAGEKTWTTYTFENGKPVYNRNPQPDEDITIDMLLDGEIEITKDDDAIGIPAGSYYTSKILPLAFWGEGNKTQKMYMDFEGFPLLLDRIDGAEHEFSDVEYTWDGADCTATVTCAGCTETVTETVTGVFKQDTAATCTEAAKGHYEATFNNTLFGSAQTAANSVTKGDPDPANHATEGRTSVAAQEANCQHIGWDAYELCACGEKLGYNEYPMTEHVDGNGDFICDNCTYEFLAEAKAAAIAEINKLAGATPSAAVRAIVEEALADIESAETVAKVNSIKDQALKDIKAQQEAEKPVKKSWLDTLLDMLDQYLPTVGKITRNLINATIKAIKNTTAVINYLEKLFNIF